MHIRLIDGNSIGYAQHHARPEMTTPAGMEVQAVEGFLRHIRSWRQSEPESLHVILWDGRAQWRYDRAPEYKSGRHRTEEQRRTRKAYEEQRPWICQALAALPIVQLTHPTMEADDLAFALSYELSSQGHLVSLFTADQDWQQCVRSRVSWQNAKKREQVIDEYSFRKDTGCANSKAFIEVKALMGDVSDSLEGAPGIADVRAKEVLAQWGSLYAFWDAAADPFFQGPKHLLQAALPEIRERIERNKLLMDLSAAPIPDASLVKLVFGEMCDIDLYEVCSDLALDELCDSFEYFCRPFALELTKEQVALFRRATANMPRAYPTPESRK